MNRQRNEQWTETQQTKSQLLYTHNSQHNEIYFRICTSNKTSKNKQKNFFFFWHCLQFCLLLYLIYMGNLIECTRTGTLSTTINHDMFIFYFYIFYHVPCGASLLWILPCFLLGALLPPSRSRKKTLVPPSKSLMPTIASPKFVLNSNNFLGLL